jgi:hypothetical protein
MRRYSMPDRDAAAKLIPKSHNDRKTFWTICGYLAMTIVFVAVALFFQHRRQREMEETWQSTTATIEDVRPVVASQVESQVGSAMLYQVEILARYSADGAEQRQWIKVGGLPKPRPDDFQISRWKGKQCVVRWKASQPNQVVAQLN